MSKQLSFTCRNQAVELLRIISAYLIICYHANLFGASLAYSGLSIFLMLSTYFAVGPNFNKPEQTNRLFITLMVPWAFWFVVYEALFLVKGKPFFMGYENPIAWLLAGPSIHLWYIPFIFVVLIGLNWLKTRMKQPHFLFVSVGFSVLLLVTIPIWRPWSLSVGAPIAQYFQALTPLLLGLVLASQSAVKWGQLGLTLILALLLVTGVTTTFTGVAWPHLIGAVLVISALVLGRLLPHIHVEAVSKHMFGIYLIHPIALAVIPDSVPLNWLLVPLSAFILSLLIAMTATELRKRFAPNLPSIV